MDSQPYHIKSMTPGDLELAIAWAAQEGWNPGRQDASCFYAADPTGFLMGFLNGEPIAAISAVKYGESFGFIGLYIVKPAFRGQGYGLALWQAAITHLQGRTIGLDGVVAQQDNYRRSGFTLAHQNIRYRGTGSKTVAKTAANAVPLAQVPLATVIDYDRRFFPADRADFIRGWIAQPQGHSVGVMQGSSLVGYGVLRPCQTGYKIGPLFADTAAIADELFQALAAHVSPQQPVYLDVPAVNAEALALAERYAMHPDFETARMYTHQAPNLPLKQIFGITTFELG